MNKLLICCFSLILMYPLGIDLYLVGLPEIAASLNASEADLHAAFSIYLIGMASTMVFGGFAADKLGRKPVAIVGSIIFAVASWWAMGATTSQGFFFARFGQGIGAGFCYVVTFAILRDALDDDKRAKVLSMINGITCIVPVLAPVIGHLIMLKFAWTSLFLAMATAAAFIGLLCLFLLKESRPNTTKEKGSTYQPNIPPQHAYHAFLNRIYLSRLVNTSLCVTAILTYVGVSPMLLMDTLGFDKGQYATAMAMLAGVSMISSFLTPKLLSQFGQQKIIIVSQAFFFFSATILWMANQQQSSYAVYMLGFAFICSGFSIGFGTLTSQALAPFKLHAGLASSILGVCQVSFSAFYIWFMGWLGISAINILMILLFLAAVVNLFLIMTIRQPEPNATIACNQ
ncbi:MFS transporter [Photobacterium makurazakiensis]|uniref:MFS transporter n=1 Tax=Photobacterium makurazakiensis TaxID=2910234 RepID=UPI003D115178